MRALIQDPVTKILALRDSWPEPQRQPDQHLLKVDSIALTKGELLWPRGDANDDYSPGVEMSGVVVAAPAKSRFPAGSKIYMRTTFPRSGSGRDFSIGLEAELAIRPNNVTAEEAASMPVSALTAWQALFVHGGVLPIFDSENRGALPSGEKRVLVNGAAGNVGMWMVQLAHTAGHYVGGTGTSRNAEFMKESGVQEVIDYATTSIRDHMADRADDMKFDLVLDCVGGCSMTDAWYALRPGGLLISVAPPADMQYKFVLDPPEGASANVQGKFFIMESDGSQLQKISELVEKGLAKPCVDSVYRVQDFEKAFQKVEHGKTRGKVILQIA